MTRRVLIDACVLYPNVMRSLVLAVAGKGMFKPLWSERILEEWARATARRGAVDEAQARGEIAVLRAQWPDASVEPHGRDLARLWLPDENDVHVLAAAIAGSADLLLTLNAKDFPRHTLAEEGLRRLAPDEFLHELWLDDPESVSEAADAVRAEAERMDSAPRDMRALFKKARLPRLGKALAGK